MEAFTLLRYWRTAGGTGGATTEASTFTARATTKSTTSTPYSGYGEDGPYFDLEFTLAEEKAEKDLEIFEKSRNALSETGSGAEELSENENDEEEVQFALTDDEYSMTTSSPLDGLLFNGSSVPIIEPSTVILNDSEENCKFPVSLLRSATMLRFLLLKLKKSKSENSDNKLFTVKLNDEEVKGPLVSLFARDNNNSEDSNSVSDERKLTKELVQKYLKVLKPLYIRVSSRCVENMKFSCQVNFPGSPKGGDVAEVAAPSNLKTKQENSINIQAGLKVVRKHLGKSRSTSAMVAVSPAEQMAAANRRDDSLVELQDGIQGAILHCKRSFNATRDGESATVLSRSTSDPSL